MLLLSGPPELPQLKNRLALVMDHDQVGFGCLSLAALWHLLGCGRMGKAEDLAGDGN